MTIIDKDYWQSRHWEVTQDLLAARQSKGKFAHLDVAALEKYLLWLKQMEGKCKA